MANVWQLKPVFREDGKVDYQPCEVVITGLIGDPNQGTHRCFQNISIMTDSGGNAPAAISYKIGEQITNLLPENKLRTPITCRVKIEESTDSRNSVNGYKYTFMMASEKKSGSAPTTGKMTYTGQAAHHTDNPEERTRSICLSYAVTLASQKLIAGQDTEDLINSIKFVADLFTDYVKNGSPKIPI